MFTVLIFFTTIICILIFNLVKKKSFKDIFNFFNFFDFFNNFLNFNFFRKQNLSIQNARKAANRVVIKKNNKTAAYIKKNDPETKSA